MNRHLSDEQVAALLLGGASGEAGAHVAECGECRMEDQRLRTALGGYGEAVRGAAERPEAFWAWQRVAIAGQLTARRTHSRRLVWAAAMALLVMLASALVRQGAPEPVAAQTDPDHALLVEVERSMQRDVPVALAPAALLAQEMSRAADGKTNR